MTPYYVIKLLNPMTRAYLLECMMTTGKRKGAVFILGNPAAPMTHAEACHFTAAHTVHPFRVLRLREVTTTK